MKRWSAVHYLLAGQGIFFAALVLECYLLFDRMLLTDGISYFGVHMETIVPYAISFLAASWCLWQASFALAEALSVVRRAFRLMSVFLLGLLATPYSLSALTGLVHDGFGTALFLTEVLLGGWLAFWVTKNFWHRMLYIVQLGAAIAAAFSLLNIADVMFYAQVICQIAFSVLIVLEVTQLERSQMLQLSPTPERIPNRTDNV